MKPDTLRDMIKAAFSKAEIEPSKIFVMTFDNGFTCNPAAICEELLKSDLRPDIVWAVDDKTDLKVFPPQIRTVRRGSGEMFMEMRTAHIWLDNGINCAWYFMPKHKGQIYIDTWHGSLGIKKLGGNFAWRLRARTLRRKTDYLISNSRFEEEVFASTYWKDVPCMRFGHARNSLLFKTELHDAVASKVRYDLNIPAGKKIVLYAPTFRDNGDRDFAKIDPAAVAEMMNRRFGGEHIILMRLHMKSRGDASYAGENVIDASAYPDMRALMIAADVGITDYSSWIFDYMHLGRPAFIFAPDAGDYETQRGFYYPLTETPFPVSSDMEGLCSQIADLDEEMYRVRVMRFLEQKECADDRDSAVRAARFVLDKCRDIV